ncbi:MAG: hypothetical protein ACI8QH_000155 [Flammeovirgaceae bacterium]|jgi:hypothetical protein
MEGNETTAILAGMSEVEMAFYAKYKLNHHSRDSKKKLIYTLEAKGLTKKRIKEITTSELFSESHHDRSCNRCGSSKVYQHKTDSEKKKTHCLICGFVEGTKKSKFKLFELLFGV